MNNPVSLLQCWIDMQMLELQRVQVRPLDANPPYAMASELELAGMRKAFAMIACELKRIENGAQGESDAGV